MSHPHFDHVQAHLDRIRYGHLVDSSPDSLYLGAQEGESFWELVGLRVTGCPVVVLALLRFQHLGLPGVPNSRESLSSYLSNLPAPQAADEIGALSVILPPRDQGIPLFLKRLRAGIRVGLVTLDPARVELAFDFRLQNPTLVADLRDEAQPLRDHYYRTVDGHLFRGRSHEIPATVTGDHHRFVAISSPEQLTPQGTYPLPTLFVNRTYLALRARARTVEELAALKNWVPFLTDAANPGSLLPTHSRRPGEGPPHGSAPPA